MLPGLSYAGSAPACKHLERQPSDEGTRAAQQRHRASCRRWVCARCIVGVDHTEAPGVDRPAASALGGGILRINIRTRADRIRHDRAVEDVHELGANVEVVAGFLAETKVATRRSRFHAVGVARENRNTKRWSKVQCYWTATAPKRPDSGSGRSRGCSCECR